MRLTRDELVEATELDLRFRLSADPFGTPGLSTRTGWVADLGALQLSLHVVVGETRGRVAWSAVRKRFRAHVKTKRVVPSSMARWTDLILDLPAAAGASRGELKEVAHALEVWTTLRLRVEETLETALTGTTALRSAWLRAVVRRGKKADFYNFLTALCDGDRMIVKDVRALDLQLARGDYGLTILTILRAIVRRSAIAEAEDETDSVDVRVTPLARALRAWALLLPDEVGPHDLEGWLGAFVEDLNATLRGTDDGALLPPVARFELGGEAIVAIGQGGFLESVEHHRWIDGLLNADAGDVVHPQVVTLRGRSLLGLTPAASRVSMALAYVLRRCRNSFAQRVMPSLKSFGKFDRVMREWVEARSNPPSRAIPSLAPSLTRSGKQWQNAWWNVRDGDSLVTGSRLFCLVCRRLVEHPEAWRSLARDLELADSTEPDIHTVRAVWMLPELEEAQDVIPCSNHPREVLRTWWLGGLHFRLADFASRFAASDEGRNAIIRERGLRPPRLEHRSGPEDAIQRALDDIVAPLIERLETRQALVIDSDDVRATLVRQLAEDLTYAVDPEPKFAFERIVHRAEGLGVSLRAGFSVSSLRP